MRVEDLMSHVVAAIAADATLRQAATQMKSHDVGWLPVLNSREVIGVVSDRDIVVRAVASGLDPEATRVKEVMTPVPFWCAFDATVEGAAEFMAKQKVRRLLVADHRKQPVGVISLGDLAAKLDDKKLAGSVLRRLCSRT
jgi:CBS domain-containing protein